MSTDGTHETIGFLGLGALGSPLVDNLIESGKTVRIWNRTAGKTEAFVQKGATAVARPADAITRGGIVFSILWDNASLAEVVHSDGFLDALGPGGIHVSMTTVTPAMAREIEALHAARGSIYVEAPIFGVPAQAKARQLLFCLTGQTAAKERVKPFLEAMGAARIFDFGEPIGAGTATKLVGNYMIISAFSALQEGYDALRANGVDPKPTLEMLTTTLFATPGIQRYAGYLASGAPIPNTGIPQKDVGLFESFASSAHLSVPMASRLHEILTAAAKAKQ